MENTTADSTSPSSSTALDEAKILQYREKLRLEQNLPMALAAGFAAALVGGILWAVITVVTNYQIGFMAVGVGLLVGYAVRYFGKGIDPIFGVAGAVLALLGCLLGNFFRSHLKNTSPRVRLRFSKPNPESKRAFEGLRLTASSIFEMASSMVGFGADAENVGVFELLGVLDYSYVPEIMMEGFSPMDLLFYGIAVYEGYKFSFRKFTEAEIRQNA
jgi:hypothetical protein